MTETIGGLVNLKSPLLFALASLLVSTTAAAQSPSDDDDVQVDRVPPPPPPPVRGATPAPAACDPPCEANERCTSAGQCVRKRKKHVEEDEESAGDEAPSADSGVHLHDGFYFRVGLGYAHFIGSFSPDSGTSSSTSGPGVGLELSFGGTPARGLVLGGGIFGGSAPSATVTTGSVSGTAQATMSMLGAFLDYYPDPKNGLHFLGALGPTVVQYQDSNDSNNKITGTGFGILGGVGYEWWIGQQWSFGLLGRLHYATAKLSDNITAPLNAGSITVSGSSSTIMPSLLAEFTYH